MRNPGLESNQFSLAPRRRAPRSRNNRIAPSRSRIPSVGVLILLPLLLGDSTQAAVTYQEIIRPLFQDSCLNCHNPDKHKAGLDLSTYDATMDGSDNGKVVQAGNPDKSLLLRVLTHEEEPYMPKGGDKLADAQIEAVRQWIEANAPEKAGSMVAAANTGPSVATVPIEEKPKGPPIMPRDGLLEPYVHTVRRGAVPSIAGSPWAPLVALAAQKQVLLYNTDTLQLVSVLPFPEGFPQVVRFSHNGSVLIAGGGIGAKLGHVVVWDVATGKRIAQIGDEFDTVLAADISPDQSLVALGGPGRLVKIFSARDGKLICKMKKHTDWVTELCFTPDGKTLISGDRVGGISAWDCQGHELQSVSAHTAGVTGIACRGSYVATSSEDGTVKLWNIVEGTELKSWKAHVLGVRSVAFTADGRILTSGRDHLVRLWDIDGNSIKVLDPLNDIAMQATVAGGKIIAADWSGLVRVWSADGKLLGNLESNPLTISQRMEALDEKLELLQSREAEGRVAEGRAASAVAGLKKSEQDNLAGITARKEALATAQAHVKALRAEQTLCTNAVQQMLRQDTALTGAARDIAWLAAMDELMAPEAVAVAEQRWLIENELQSQRARDARLPASITATAKQVSALTLEILNREHAEDEFQVAMKSALANLSAAQAGDQKLAGEIQEANAALMKWRAAATRIAGDAQYAARKTEASAGVPR